MTTQDPTIVEAEGQESGPQGLRDHVDRLENELKEEREAASLILKENVAFKVAATGLNPEQGIGKSIVKDIQRGDYEGEITPTALAAYASDEYGETLDALETPPVTPATPEPVKDENALATAQEQTDAVQTASKSQDPPPIEPSDTISELQKEMLRPDATPEEVSRAVDSSITAKVHQLQDDIKRGRILTTPEP